MLKLIPYPKNIQIKDGLLKNKYIKTFRGVNDERLISQIKKLPFDDNGATLIFNVENCDGENYSICVQENQIIVDAKGIKGAFYAIQTIRQLLDNDVVPCLCLQDNPDFKYRGFYHDITRGKIPTLDTLKGLVDTLAYYKYNSLQLYVEHVYDFKETSEIVKRTGFISASELKELDEYCKANFMDFIPSLSTFGHMYEILMEEKYKGLRVKKDFANPVNKWAARMRHHTIDPNNVYSIELVKSLIDQYCTNFTSDYFNICCDETFDLKEAYGEQSSQIYVEFVEQIIKHVVSKDKKVMMWADILLAHPETIELLPKDTLFLNWDYRPQPEKENVDKFKQLNRSQIVCPGTWSWNNFCEDVLDSEPNICKMAEYGYENGAMGMLVTNWGDYNNICSLELSQYGLVLGAEKCWNPTRVIDEKFYNSVDFITYKCDKGVKLLRLLNSLQLNVSWSDFCYYATHTFANKEVDPRAIYSIEFIQEKQKQYLEFTEQLNSLDGDFGDFKKEMELAAKGIMLIIEANAKLSKKSLAQSVVDYKTWLDEYSSLWLKKNKPSELYRIIELFEKVFTR